MTLLRALVSRFSALLGDVYYEGTVPPDAPYPYAVISVSYTHLTLPTKLEV